MFKNIFYKTNLKWTKKFVENNINTIEKNYVLYPNKNRWMVMTIREKFADLRF